MSPTTAQSLGALLKSARDIMRKDKGLNGDLDRLPMLTWIMFLKFLDDLELQREGEAQLSGKKFKPAIEPPYRWRDWAPSSTTRRPLARTARRARVCSATSAPSPAPTATTAAMSSPPCSRVCRTGWSAVTSCAMSLTS
jgi:type I restriction enzyme M protein